MYHSSSCIHNYTFSSDIDRTSEGLQRSPNQFGKKYWKKTFKRERDIIQKQLGTGEHSFHFILHEEINLRTK